MTFPVEAQHLALNDQMQTLAACPHGATALPTGSLVQSDERDLRHSGGYWTDGTETVLSCYHVRQTTRLALSGRTEDSPASWGI